MAKIIEEPVWYDTQRKRFASLAGKARHVDAVIVGGGITGVSAAAFLKQAGKKVVLLERDRIGGGDTGHTTAHLTCVTDVRLKQLIRTFGREQAGLAWYGGMAAMDWIEKLVNDNGIRCEFRRLPAFLHASLKEQVDDEDVLKEEVSLARELGFAVDYVDSVPVVDKPGMRVSNQAKFQPLAYLYGLATLVDGDGSGIFENTEVNEVEDDPLVVVANGVRISCDYLVVATHVPILGAAGLLKATFLQSKLTLYSTYAISGRIEEDVPDVSLFDTSNPYYYLRVDSEEGYKRVIFGGNDHKTGQVENTEECYRSLEQKLHEVLPQAAIDHRWSGQVIETNDGLPFIGEIAPRQFIATGFNGNGFTFATLAGLMARDAILGKENPWSELYSVNRTHIRAGAWDYLKQNIDYPYYMIADRLKRPKSDSTRNVRRGTGKILNIDGERVACSRDDNGKLHQVSAICTHLGCVVHWNGAEKTWDCPCHGSRFQSTGEVISGPAETPLPPSHAKKPKVKTKSSNKASAKLQTKNSSRPSKRSR